MGNNTERSGLRPDHLQDEANRPQSKDQDQALDSGNARSATLEAELADMRDRWMRSEAEIANVRNRAKRDVDDAKQYAVQKFATDVVEAAENLRRGLDNIPAASVSEPEIVSRLRDGFLGVERSFIGLLKRNGIVREDPTGTAFDPQVHQAMSEAVSDNREPGTVLQALSATWTLNGRLLRPAMVVVAKASDTRKCPG